MKRKSPVRTKLPMQHVAFRLKREDRELWRKAATILDQSMGEFLRTALREKAARCFPGDVSRGIVQRGL
jgi:uncharacterized protein (DUF1778 family)